MNFPTKFSNIPKDYEVTILGETPESVRIRDRGCQEYYLPKSQVKIVNIDREHAVVRVPNWLASIHLMT